MKLVCTLLLCAVLGAGAMAQQATIQELEALAQSQQGEPFIQTALALADAHLQANNWNAAGDWADRVLATAKSSAWQEYAARAHHLKGRAYAMSDKRTQRARAIGFWEDSNKLSNNANLKRANWEAIAQLAAALGRQQLVRKAEAELALLDASPAGGAQQSRLRTLANLRKNDTNAIPPPTQQQQQQLERVLAAKESELKAMSANQMRQELLLMEQYRLLDSMQFRSVLDSFQLAKQANDLAQQEATLQQQASDLALQESRQKLWMALAGLVLIVAAGWYHRHRSILEHNHVLEEKNNLILAEKQRSDELLLNILPLAVANELKDKGAAQARHYEQATVLFTDFKDFSRIAQQLSPGLLVEALDYAFTAFDDIVARHGLEKIKTIGDAYMCAGGLPSVNPTHPQDVVRAALDMQRFLDDWNTQRRQQGMPCFEARIGIHTGPLVAGVVGAKKFAYDIWGDTVNVAARMESSGQVGTVNISGPTFELVKNHFQCEARGLVEIKNLGKVDMYFVQAPAKVA